MPIRTCARSSWGSATTTPRRSPASWTSCRRSAFIRSGSAPERARSTTGAGRTSPMYPMLNGHPIEVVRRLLPELRRYPLYVTIDVDVLDPAEAPGTGSPEPGGLRVPELVEIV